MKIFTRSIKKNVNTIFVLSFLILVSFRVQAQVVTTWGSLSGTLPENNFATSSLSAVADGVTVVTVDISRSSSATVGGPVNAVAPGLTLANSFNNARATIGVSGNTYTYVFSEPVHVILSSEEHSDLVRTENIKISSPDAGALFSGSLFGTQNGHFINNNNTSEIHIGSNASITTPGTYWTVQSTTAITTLSIEYYVTNPTEVASGEPFTMNLAPIPFVRLDNANATGAGGIDLNTTACSTGWEPTDNTNTGASSDLNAPHGIQSMTVTLTNPQDIGQEELTMPGGFTGILVSGNNTTSLTISNDGNATESEFRQALDDIFYLNNLVNPTTGINRLLDVQITDIYGNLSNIATATFPVIRGPQSGTTAGPLIIFTGDGPTDLFTGLDGSEDSGGTWIDVDGTGALTGSIVDEATLPLGGSIFRYEVSGTSPCSNASTTLVVIKMSNTEIALTSPSACGELVTAYTNPLQSANSDDPIFVFDSGTGELVCPPGGPGTVYDWYIFNPTTNSYDVFALGSTSTQTGLADGGYLVVRNDAGIVEEGRAWVWNSSLVIDAGTDQTVCAGDTVNLAGSGTVTNPVYTYYDPVPRPFPITATTEITITFDATHTYVSDLGFFAVAPDGTTTVTLGPNQGNTCNSGDDVSGLSFTTNTVGNVFNFCSPVTAPLTGTYDQYFDGTATFPIDWTPFIGFDARQGGWAVQIYDCVAADTGTLDGATIVFDDGLGNVATYTSGSISVAINDNSCTPATASIYVVPFVPATPGIDNSISLSDGIGVGGAGGYEWSYSTAGPTGPWSGPFENNTLSPSRVVNETTWFRIEGDNGVSCETEDVVQISVVNPPNSGVGTDEFACAGDPIVNLNALLTGADIGGVWSVSGSSPDTPGGDFNSGAGTYDPTTGGVYVFDYTVNATIPCTTNATTSITVSVLSADSGINNTINANSASGVINLFSNLLGSPDTGGTWSLSASGDNPGANFDQGLGTLDSAGLANGTYIFDYTVVSCLATTSTITVIFSAVDTDNDGVGDAVDQDDDNDGILDTAENPLNIDPSADADNDGIPNYEDFDDNGSATAPVCTDTDLNGICDVLDPIFDIDNDGVPNHFDLDSDNDGIYDVVEAGGTDTNNDGRHDDDDNNTDNTATNGVPSEANAGAGISNPTDTGNDGSFDYLNLDSDSDGCSDANEAYNDPNADGGDSGVFGPDPATTDPITGVVTTALYTDPVDADSAGGLDFQQIGGPDGDSDGIPDACDPVFNDLDGDGVGDAVDLDDDNDGILDTVECPISYVNLSPDLLGVTTDPTVNGSITNVDISASFGLPAGSVLISGTGLNRQTSNRFVVGATYAPNDISTFTISGTAVSRVRVQLEHGRTLGINQFDRIESLDGSTYRLTSPLAANFTDTSIPPVYQVRNDTGAANPDAFTWDSIDRGVTSFSLSSTNPGDNSVIRIRLSIDPDTDGDGIVDCLDLDSDNDGITDLVESGQLDNGATDTNRDGIIDGVPSDFGNNGLANSVESDDTAAATTANPTATDGTGGPNYIDIDADDDGIVDNVEAQSTSGYLPPSGNDTDGDGIDDQYDADCSIGTCGIAGAPIIPVNTDASNANSDTDPDYIDLDSDGDGESDTIEAYDSNNDGVVDATDTIGATPDLGALGVDSDGDGLDDEFDTDDASFDPTNGGQTAANPFPDTDSAGGEPNWREDSIELTTIKTSVLDITGGADATVADAGDQITYTYAVQNTGNITLTSVGVSETAFSGTGGAPTPGFISNSGTSPAGTLISGEIATFRATYTITQADIDAGGIENSATATGTPPSIVGLPPATPITDVSDAGDDTINEPGLDGTDDGDADFENDPTVTLVPASPSLATIKTSVLDITGGADATIADVGDTFTYTYTVTNTGNTTLTSVGVNETAFSGTGGTPTPGFISNSGTSVAGTLVPGEIATFRATYTITQADIDAGGIENSATGTGTPPADPDGTVNPAITDVSDAGDDTINEPGLDGTADGDADFENDPTVSLIPASASLATVKTSVLDITGGADATVADVGDQITYTYTVTNTGNTTLTSVGVSETAFSGTGGTPTPGFVSNSGASPPGTLVPGEIATFRVTYAITQADIDAGGIENSATGTGTPPADPDGTVNAAITDVSDAGDDTLNEPGLDGTTDGDADFENDPTVTLIPVSSSLATVKTSVLDITGGTDATIADVGDQITYTYTVTNTGNTTLTSVGVSETAFSGTGGTPTPGFVSNSGASPSGTLVPGEIATFRVTYAITQADINAGGIENSATGTGTPPADPDGTVNPPLTDVSDAGDDTINEPGLDGTDDGDADFENDPTVSLIPASASLSTVKAGVLDITGGADATVADVGDQITYTYTIQNTGNVDLNGVNISETAFSGTGGTPTPVFISNSGTSPIGMLVPGEIATFRATYTITQADIDAGGIENSATATGIPPADPDGTVNPAITDVSDAGDDTINEPGLDGTDDGDADFENDPTVTLVPASSSLATIKTSVLDITGGADATIADVGDTFTYTYTVTNTGNTTLTSVGVNETSFSGTGGTPTPGFISNSGTSVAGTLVPGEIATFRATYTITQADIDAGGIENSATGTGTPPADPDGTVNPPLTDVSDAGDDTINEPGLDGTDDGDADFENDPTVSLIPASASLSTVKAGVLDITGGADATVADVGDQITYTYTVTNTGNTTLTSVGVSETAFSGTGGTPTPGFVSNSGASPPGTLVPGEIATFRVTYAITQADIDAGGIENSATGTGTPPADPDGTVNAAITDVSDAGDDTLNEPGLDGTTDGDADFENDPTVTLIPVSSSLATVKTSVLDITGGTDATIADVGDQITYTYTVTNTGNTTLTSVGVSETAFSGTGGTPTPGFVSNSGASPSGTLVPGEIATFRVTYAITQADINAGGIENSATGTGTPPADPDGTVNPPLTDVSDAGDDTINEPGLDGTDDGDADFENDPTVSLIPASASLSTVKAGVLDITGGADATVADVGDQITYTYTIQNTGNVDLNGVNISETAFSGTGGTPTPVFISNSGTSPIGMLVPGEIATFRATYTITQADIDAGGIENSATATGIPPADPDGTVNPAITDVSDAGDDTINEPGLDGTDDGDADFENDPTVTLVPASSSLATIKTSVLDITGGADATIADVGDTFTYTYTVTNTGNTTLTSVGVNETSFSGTGGTPTPGFISNSGTSVAGTLVPGEIATFRATYTITQADIDAGGIENSATGTGTPPADPDGTVNPPLTDVSDAGDDTINEPGLDGTDDGDADFENDPTVSLIPASASLSTVKAGVLDITGGADATVADVGDQITYTYTVTNTGNTTLTSVGVSETAFSGTGGTPTPGFVSNSGASPPGTLVPGEIATFRVTYAITQADIDAGGIENSATSTGTPPADPDGTVNPVVTDVSDAGDETVETPDIDGNTDGDPTNDPTITTIPSSPELVLTKSAVINDGGDGVVDAGDTIDYTFDVENTGNVTVSNIEVTDLLTGSIDVAITPSNLLPGTTGSVTVSYTIRQIDIDNGTITNSATATGDSPTGTGDVVDVSDDGDETVDGPDADTDPTNDPTVTTLPPNPSVVITKADNAPADGSYDTVGEVITYTILVTNDGNVTLTDVEVTDGNADTITPGTIASIDPGETVSVTATHTITQPDLDNGEVINTASATGDSPTGTDDVTDDSDDPDTPAPDDATITSVDRNPELTLTKFANDAPDGAYDTVGEVITYELEVINTGNVTLINVAVTDVNADVGSITPATIGSLAPGARVMVTAEHTITQPDLDAGVVINRADVMGEAPDGTIVMDMSDDPTTPDPDDATETNTGLVTEGRLAVSKMANPRIFSAVGDLITYTIEIENTGTVTLTNIIVNDPNATIVSGLPITTLVPGGTATVIAEHIVTQSDLIAGQVVNTAEVTGTTPVGEIITETSDDPDNPDNVDPDADGDPDDPTISAIDSDGDGIADPDDLDDDNDGITDIEEQNGDPNLDTDGDGIIDRLDLDADGDGVLDVYESGADLTEITISEDGRIVGDVGNDGIPNDVQNVGESDSGIVNYSIQDTDGDGIDDFQDIDDDNDDILTVDENPDPNGDGNPDDAFDTDGNGTPDYLEPNNPITDGEDGITVFNGLSPNGDGLNDRFIISGIERLENTLEIYNRWGVKVFESQNYGRGDNFFRGISNGRATVEEKDQLPVGTYYYVLEYVLESGERKSRAGYLYINR